MSLYSICLVSMACTIVRTRHAVEWDCRVAVEHPFLFYGICKVKHMSSILIVLD